MKASLVVLSSVFLLSAPVLAHAGDGVLKASLANAARETMNVAPWVDVSVPAVQTSDKVEWIAVTSARQVYVCSAAGTVKQGLVGQADCARVQADAAQRAAGANGSLYPSRGELQQRKRMSVTIPVSFNAETPAGAVTLSPGNMVTLSAY